jgi:hypothetical protein
LSPIEKDTRGSTRSFIRTWFIRSFPQDFPNEADFEKDSTFTSPKIEGNYLNLTIALQSDPTDLLCDTANAIVGSYCDDLRRYVEVDPSVRNIANDVDEFNRSTSMVTVNQYMAPEYVIEKIAPEYSVGGTKDEKEVEEEDTCSIIKKSTDNDFEEELEEILDSPDNLIIGELPDTIKGGLLIRKMRKNRKTRKVRKTRKTKRVRKINKKRKTMQSKRKRKYKK